MISKAEKEGILKYLKTRFNYYICKSRQQYRHFDNFGNLKFVELPLSTLQISNGLSQYRQAKILNELISENKLIIKLGKGRKRYYTIIKEQTNEKHN